MSEESWKVSCLSDIAAIIDCPHSTPKWTESGYFVIRNWNVRNGRLNSDRASYTDKEHYLERIRRSQPEFQDLVLTREAPMGEVCMIPEGLKCCLGQRVVLLKANHQVVNPAFLLFSIQSPFVKNQIYSHEGTGSTVSNLRIPAIANLEIPLPPLPTQTRIAAILSALDDKIELNRQTNATLEAIAQAIFKEWFVDFRYPGSTGEMQDSELGPIPKGWRVGKLGDICDLNPRFSLKKGSLAKYVEMKNLSQTSLSIEAPREREFTSGSKFQNGDTLLARITPCLENGKTGFVDFLDDNEIGWGSTEFIVLRGKNHLNPFYVYCLSRLPNFREFAIQSMVGSSGRQRVVESILAEYPVAIPDKYTSDTYSRTIEKMFSQIKNHSDQSADLSKIRDALLPKLMNGEIPVGPAEWHHCGGEKFFAPTASLSNDPPGMP